jgi:hypothetical protein
MTGQSRRPGRKSRAISHPDSIVILATAARRAGGPVWAGTILDSLEQFAEIADCGRTPAQRRRRAIALGQLMPDVARLCQVLGVGTPLVKN